MFRTILLAAILVSMLHHSSRAAFIDGPVQWQASGGGNDHFYGVFQSEGITWTGARDAAAAMEFMGTSGQLVTITSQDESNFLQANFSDTIGDPNAPGGIFPPVPGIRAWIGLSDAVSEGNFQWVTGEPFAFSNWAGPEPNNLGVDGGEKAERPAESGGRWDFGAPR